MAVLEKLIEWWSLDAASGNETGAHRSHVLVDSNTVGSTTGVVSNARDFEVSNTESMYVTIGEELDFRFGDEDFTINIWANIESAHVGALYGKYQSSTNGYGCYYSANKLYFFVVGSGGYVEVACSETISVGTTYMVTGYHDSVNNVIGIRINGGAAATTSTSGGVTVNTGALYLGRNIHGAYFDGWLDEWGIWNKVLSGTEVTWLYNSGSGRSYSDVVAAADVPVLSSWASFADSGNLTSRTIDNPAGTVSGNWLVLGVVSDAGAVINTPTGFTERHNILISGSYIRLALFTRKADGTEGSTFTITSDSEYLTGIILRIQNGDSTDVLDVLSSSAGELGESPNIRCPLAYSETDGAMVLRIGASDGAITFTQPSSHTAITQVQGAASGASLAMAYTTKATAGYVDAAHFVSSNATEEYIGMTVILRSTSTAAAYPDQPVLRCLSYQMPSSALAGAINKPYGTEENDLLIVDRVSEASNFETLTGFTDIRDVTTGSVTVKHGAHYKVAGGSEPASYSIFTSTAGACQAVLMRIVNADTTTPVSASSSNTGTSTTPTATTITPTQDNSLIFWSSGNDDDDTGFDTGYPAGYTGVFAVSNQEAADSGHMLAFKTQTTAAATGSAAGTLDASEEWIAFHYAISPASGGGSISGELTATLGAATLSSAGAVAIDGDLSATLGTLTSSAAGTVSLSGELSKTLDAATLSSVIALTPISGELSATLGAATLSSAGTVLISGAATPTLAAVSLSSASTIAIEGTLTATLGNVTTSSASELDIAGEAGGTLAAATLGATGALALTGELATTLGAASLSATGEVQAAGTLSATLAAATLSSAGTLPIAGTLSATLAAVSTASASELDIAGEGATTLGNDTLSATGTLLIDGSLSATLGNVALSAEGTSQTVGELSVTLGAVTLSSAGVLPIQGALTSTLAAVTTSSASEIDIAGDSATTLAADTLSATGTLLIDGSLNATLAALALSAEGTSGSSGSVEVTLAAATLSSAATLDIAGELSGTLGNVTGSGSGELPIEGLGSGQLGALTLSSAGTVAIAGTLSQTLAAASLSAEGETAASSRTGALSATLGNLTLIATGDNAAESQQPTGGFIPREWRRKRYGVEDEKGRITYYDTYEEALQAFLGPAPAKKKKKKAPKVKTRKILYLGEPVQEYTVKGQPGLEVIRKRDDLLVRLLERAIEKRLAEMAEASEDDEILLLLAA